jgi:hypothetical protein
MLLIISKCLWGLVKLMSVPAGIENVNIYFQLKPLFQVPLFEALEMRGCRFPVLR